MRPLREFSAEARRRVRFVLTDIDDTLTEDGLLKAEAFASLHRLAGAGLSVIPVTGRPAGWCDHIARMWPVAAVVGENGAFYFRYDRQDRRMLRRYFRPENERRADRDRLAALAGEILAAVPGARISADQAFREADLAVDFCEDVVPRLPLAEARRIADIFTAAGARAKISSIHVNGWFGDYDKLSMTKRMFKELWGIELDAEKDFAVFVGDSPNDAPMFAYFPYAVGVANVRDFKGILKASPAFVTRARGGLGFAELAKCLLFARDR